MNFAYDTLNRLIEVQDGASKLIARYGYDPLSRRLWKEQYRDAAGTPLASPKRTLYLYADEGLIAEATQAIALNNDGSVTTLESPSISRQYGPRPNAPFTTGILFVKTANSNGEDVFAYYHHDHLNTPLMATDKVGNILWAASYNAYGMATITTPTATADKPTIDSNLRLPGQFWDEETGLHYNWFRYYDPIIGRYISVDPIGLKNRSLTLYVYVNGNPLRYSDSQGLEAELCTRMFYPFPVPYARHCFIRFNGNDNDTSSYGPKGTQSDPAPSWFPKSCQPTNGNQNDQCLKSEMNKCQAGDYDFTGNNCCHCAEKAMKACGIAISQKNWPNWPVNPGPQPGE